MASTLERQEELIRIVNSYPNNTWVAGLDNSNVAIDSARYSPTKKYVEFQNDKKINLWHEYFNLFASANIPNKFDARKKWSSQYDEEKCPALKKVINNGKCKCGWATSIAAVVSDRLCISSNYKFKTPLSAQHLISCCKNCCSCNGGNVQLGWEYVKNRGLVTGGWFKSNIGCQPFSIVPCKKSYECSSENSKVPECWINTCIPASESNFNKTEIESAVKTRIVDYYSFSRKQPTKIMMELMEHGPLQVSMHMYEDFRVYSKGIYRHVTGDFVSDHGVKLIGWGTTDGVKYWLLMNSFGPLWGEEGLFKISMDGNDNTDFGYAIIAPKLHRNMAPATLSCLFLIYEAQILTSLI